MLQCVLFFGIVFFGARGFSHLWGLVAVGPDGAARALCGRDMGLLKIWDNLVSVRS